MDQHTFERLVAVLCDMYDYLIAQATLLAENRVCEDDLWTVTSSSMVRRSILYAVCANEELRAKFLELLPEDMKPIVESFLLLDFKTIEELSDDERVALSLLTDHYGGDTWLWARDAFQNDGEQEFPGHDLRGFDATEISDAVIRLVTSSWS